MTSIVVGGTCCNDWARRSLKAGLEAYSQASTAINIPIRYSNGSRTFKEKE